MERGIPNHKSLSAPHNPGFTCWSGQLRLPLTFLTYRSTIGWPKPHALFFITVSVQFVYDRCIFGVRLNKARRKHLWVLIIHFIGTLTWHFLLLFCSVKTAKFKIKVLMYTYMPINLPVHCMYYSVTTRAMHIFLASIREMIFFVVS